MKNTITTLPKTKKQRHEIYKWVLGQLQNPELGYFFGICSPLVSLIKWGAPINVRTLLKALPELHTKQPRTFYNSAYWFSLDEAGRAQRIEILKRCIEETKPTHRVKKITLKQKSWK